MGNSEKPVEKTIVKTRKQIAEEYGICRRTFNRWVKKYNIGLTNGLITPLEQEKIYKILEKPNYVP